jgi:hypothetical protein
MSMFVRQAASVSTTVDQRLLSSLTIPSPRDEVLCASLGSFGTPKVDSLSLDPTSVGLRATSEDRPAVEFFRQTNLSKSCSSLQSLSPMCKEQVLL